MNRSVCDEQLYSGKQFHCLHTQYIEMKPLVFPLHVAYMRRKSSKIKNLIKFEVTSKNKEFISDYYYGISCIQVFSLFGSDSLKYFVQVF